MSLPDPTTIYIHESAYVDEPCQIGGGTQILHFSHVMANSVIGTHCQIGHNVMIGSGVMVGNYVRILNNALLNSGVVLEDNVYCGPSTVFSPLRYIRGESEPVSRMRPTLVKSGASLGANTTIASGFTIGKHTFVEAGSVVDQDIPNYAVVAGNPLRFAGWRCECGSPLKFGTEEETRCTQCGKDYQRLNQYQIVPRLMDLAG